MTRLFPFSSSFYPLSILTLSISHSRKFRLIQTYTYCCLITFTYHLFAVAQWPPTSSKKSFFSIYGVVWFSHPNRNLQAHVISDVSQSFILFFIRRKVVLETSMRTSLYKITMNLSHEIISTNANRNYSSFFIIWYRISLALVYSDW